MFGIDFNLLRPTEIYLISDAIKSMVFQIHRNKSILIFEFQGQIVFKLDQSERVLSMYDTTQKTIIEVFRFRRLSFGHWMMWRRIHQAVEFYDNTVSRVKIHNYRAMFGKDYADIMIRLADLMEAAEFEAKALAKLDRTNGGTNYHPEIQRILQMDIQEEE